MITNLIVFAVLMTENVHDSVSPGLLAVIGMAVVFSGLVILQLLVNIFHSILTSFENNEQKKRAIRIKDKKPNVSNEETVAIALALHIHQSKFLAEHDYILTLKKYTKNVTPWKIGNRSGFPNVFNRTWR